MNILIWLILGLIAGWLASIVLRTNRSQGPLMDIVFGIIGAFVGGFLFNLFGFSGTTGLNLYSILVATIGAIITIWIERAVVRQT